MNNRSSIRDFISSILSSEINSESKLRIYNSLKRDLLSKKAEGKKLTTKNRVLSDENYMDFMQNNRKCKI